MRLRKQITLSVATTPNLRDGLYIHNWMSCLFSTTSILVMTTSGDDMRFLQLALGRPIARTAGVFSSTSPTSN